MVASLDRTVVVGNDASASLDQARAVVGDGLAHKRTWRPAAAASAAAGNGLVVKSSRSEVERQPGSVRPGLANSQEPNQVAASAWTPRDVQRIDWNRHVQTKCVVLLSWPLRTGL